MAEGYFSGKVHVGAGRLLDLWNSNNRFFVDGTASASGNGKSPKQAKITIAAAATAASAWATIYIKPMQYLTAATVGNRYYTENITVTEAQPGLCFVGAGPGGTHYTTTEVKTALATTSVFTVNAPGVQFENLRLTGTSLTAGTNTYSVIRAMGDASTCKGNNGMGIRDCTFSNAKIGGAVRIDNPWNCMIERCIFHNCHVGVHTSSTVSSTNGMWIKWCQFEGQPANRDVDVWMVGGSANCYGGLIDHCTFQGTVPALSGSGASIARYVYVGDTWTTGAGGLITNSNFGFDCNTMTNLVGAAGTGTMIVIPTTWEISNSYGFAQTQGRGLLTRV